MRSTVWAVILGSLSIAAAAAAPDGSPSTPADEYKLEAADASLREADATYRDALNNLTGVRGQLRDKTGLVEVTPAAVRQMIQKLQEQREELELDEAGATGRYQGLSDAINRVTAESKQRSQSDPVSEELAKVVEARQEELVRTEQAYKAGAATSSDADQVRARLAQARAELAAARQKVGHDSGEAVDTWNRQLLELSVAQQERRARLGYIEKRLAGFSSALQDLDQLEQLKQQVDAAQGNAVKAELDLHLVREQQALDRAARKALRKQQAAEEQPSPGKGQ